MLVTAPTTKATGIGDKEAFDNKGNRTTELIKDENDQCKRQLNNISRLLEISSIYTAISLVDNSFLIATDKEFSDDDETIYQGYMLIDKVMSYLKKIAEGGDNEKDYLDTCSIICNQAMAELQLPSHVKNEVIKNAINSKTADFRKLRDFISERVEMGGPQVILEAPLLFVLP